MLDILEDDAADVIAFVQECDAADLHVFTTIHGVEAEREIFAAILNHPKLDRATALEIFHVCNPAFYENELTRGVAEDELAVDEEDQVFLDIMQMAYDRLTKGRPMRKRFSAPCLREWEKFPHVCPTTFKRWPLTSDQIGASDGETPRPSIIYDYSKIKLSYEIWLRRH